MEFDAPMFLAVMIIWLPLIVLWVPVIVMLFHLYTEVKAMQKSTHSVQYVPLDPKAQEFQTVGDDVEKAFKDDNYGAIT